jgi:hypothetical protein
MPCVITTVTLQANESYTLPPGATIIGASNPSAITSLNDCADLTNLETLTGYYLQWEMAADYGPSSDAWENATLDYVRIDSTIYPVNQNAYWTTQGWTVLYDVLKTIPTLASAVVVSDSCSGHVCFFRFNIQTLPSIAKNMYFHFTITDRTANPTGTQAFVQPIII